MTRLHFSAATFAALTTLSLFGCGGGGTSSGSGGTLITNGSQYWYESSRTEDGVAKGCYTRSSDDPKKGTDASNPCQGYEFGNDGKYILWNYESKKTTGAYVAGASSIALDFSDLDAYSLTADGSTLTLSGTNVAGKKVVFTMKLVNIPA